MKTGITLNALSGKVAFYMPPTPVPFLQTPNTFLEGMVYNMDDGEVVSCLADIAKSPNPESLIRQFVNRADGDFIAIARNDKRTIIFNDRWGRLPSYYHIKKDGFIFSRQLSDILEQMPTIEIDPVSLTELLSIGFPLDRHTLFKGINYLLPSSAIISDSEGTKVSQLISTNFEVPSPTMSYEDCVKQCASAIIESLRNRTRDLERRGMEITCDLSGGRDTRMNWGGLHILQTKALPVSIGFCGESDISLKLAALYGKSLLVTPPITVSGYNSQAAKDSIFSDSCIVDYFTVLLVYGEVEARQRCLEGRRIANLSGLGGEFIRHPYHLPTYCHSIIEALDNGLMSRSFTQKEACLITGVDYDEFRHNLEAYFKGYPESNLAGQTRHLYFEYYNHLVNKGEDRWRSVQWEVSPLWSKTLFDLWVYRIPDEYVTETFFLDVMRSIDPQLLEIPFFTPATLQIHSADSRLRHLIIRAIKHSRTAMRIAKIIEPRTITAINNELTSETKVEWEKLGKLQSSLTRVGIDDLFTRPQGIWHQRLLLGVILYLQELESRFPDRIHQPEG